MPSRRRSLVSDDDPLASSSSPSSPPPAHPPATKKKGQTAAAKKAAALVLDADSSLDLVKPSRPRPPAKGKRKRPSEGDAAELPSKPMPAAKSSKRSKGDSADTMAKKPRIESDDSDDFVFTKEAYRPPPPGTVQPLPTKKAAPPRAISSQPKASSIPPKASTSRATSSQPKATAADAKGKKRAEPAASTSSLKSSSATASASQERRQMPPPSLPGPSTPKGKGRAMDAVGADSTVELAVAETPAIKRNIAMRKAADAPSDKTATRRTSFERRGRRSSIVGDGFEAVPHPSVDDALLHRHINPNELPSIRFMTLVSWSAHRQARDLASGSGGRTSARARELAGKVAEGVLANIAKHEIDVRWAEHSEAKDPSRPARPLQKNEANERNRAKERDLDQWTRQMNDEQTARSEVKPRYTALKAPRQPSAALASVPAASVNYAASPLPLLASPDDVLSYGRSLLQAAQADPATPEASTTVSVEAELAISFEELRLQASSLKQQAHRYDQFARIGDTYALSRLAAAHAALLALTLGPAPPDTADLLRALSRAELPSRR